jgi:hypothetical protein
MSTDREPTPDFKRCANCGADAAQHVYWNPTGGWSCLSCGESDYPEAAE